MKKLNLLLFVALLLFSGCDKEDPIYETPENLIKGFSFESRDHEFTSSNGSQNSFTSGWTTEEAFDGLGSLKISAASEDHDDFGFWSYRLYEPEPELNISIKVRVKTKNLIGKGVGMSAFYRDYDGLIQTVGSAEMFPDLKDNEWTTLELMVEPAAPAGVEVLDIYLLMLDNTRGSVFYDKMEIYHE